MTRKVATIGFFDGVHRGHQYLFALLRKQAALMELEPLIITFSQHPASVLCPDNQPYLLTTADERLALLERERMAMKVFDFAEICRLTAAGFLQLLHNEYAVDTLLMGYDHRFGSDGLKTQEQYQLAGQQAGVQVLLQPAMETDEKHVSSTAIRKALAGHNIQEANELLGRAYALSGIVKEGKQIGRTMGFPTANLQPQDAYKLVPGSGVYAVEAILANGEQHKAVLNIGKNPTVGGVEQTIEVHIPGLNQDLYGQTMTILFRDFLREEKQFDSLEELRQQIGKDVENVLFHG